MRFCCLLPLLLLWAVTATAAPLQVVATIHPLADLVRQVGGERVAVTTLLPAGASPHTFEPTAGQMRQLSRVQLYVRVGAGLDGWADRLLAAARQQPSILTLSEGVELLPLAELELEGAGAAHDHRSAAGDPHLWLDPLLVRDRFLPALVAQLSRLEPASAGAFRANGTRLQGELTALDRELRQQLAGLRSRDFISLHAAWGYFARRYDLHQLAAVEPFPGREPSARYLAALVKLARQRGVTTIFAEPQLPAKAADTLARELRGQVLLLDPLGGAGLAGRGSYQALLRYNGAVIRRGMGR